MTPQAAIHAVSAAFPFEGYMAPGLASDGAAYLNIARTVQRYLPVGARILDVGCGPCDKTAILSLLGYRCAGYDDLQDEWHREQTNRARIDAFVGRFGIDLRQANGGAVPFAPESFDMVMLHDVLEHLHNSPRELMNDVLELVRPEGLLFVTVPNAVNIRKRLDVLRGRSNLPRFEMFYWLPDPWRGHVREYVRDDLEHLAGFLNLQVLKLRGCDHMIAKVPVPLRRPYRLVTALVPGWKDSWSMVARKRPGWRPRRTPAASDLARIRSDSSSAYH